MRGSLAAGLNLTYNTLMADALDEVSTEYGLLAEVGEASGRTFRAATYRLRANARWHDGKPVTVDDVIFSLESFKKHHPQYAAYYRHVTKAEKTGERDVTFTFDGPGNRELPQIVGQLYVLPKHWWEGTDAQRQQARHRRRRRLEPPLGCGPYRVKSFAAGRTVVYERVKDYWGKDLNVNVGRDNFDEVRFEYFRDTTVALEAFKRRQYRLAHRELRAQLGDALRLPGAHREARDPGGIPDPQPGRDAGVRVQHAARQVQRSAGAPRVQLRVRFRGDEQAALLRPVLARRRAISKAPSSRRAACRKARSSRSSRPCRTRCRPRCSPRPTPIRPAAIPRRSAPTCAKACGC